MKTPNELYEVISSAKRTALDGIIKILKEMPNQSCNLLVDDEGRLPNDDDYNGCYHIWGIAYCKHGNEVCYLTKASLVNGELKLIFEGYDTGNEYTDGYVFEVIDLYSTLYYISQKKSKKTLS